jgi:hypothetical protein
VQIGLLGNFMNPRAKSLFGPISGNSCPSYKT